MAGTRRGASRSVLAEDAVIELGERRKFFFLDEVELCIGHTEWAGQTHAGTILVTRATHLVDEEEKVAVRRVEVRLDAEGANLGEVMVVEVGVDAEEPSDDRLDRHAKGLGELLTCASGTKADQGTLKGT